LWRWSLLLSVLAICIAVGGEIAAAVGVPRQASSFPLVTTPGRDATVAAAPTRVAYTWDPGYSVASTSKLSFRTPDRNVTVCGHDTAGYPRLAIDPPAGTGNGRVGLAAHCDVYASGGQFVSVVWADVSIKTTGVWTVRVEWGGGADRDAFAFSYSPSLPRITSLTSNVGTVSYKSCVGVPTAQVTLTWQTVGAASVSLASPAGSETVPAAGSRAMRFPCDGLGHDYVLSATGVAGTVGKPLHIGFAASTPQVLEFRAEPTNVSSRFCQTPGVHEISLVWRTAEASQVTLVGPGFSVTTQEAAGSRRFALPCDGQAHDYALVVRGILGPNAPGAARSVTVRQLGTAAAAACKYAPSTPNAWVPVAGVRLVASNGPRTWLDPTGAPIPGVAPGFSPPGGSVLRAGPQRASVTVSTTNTQVRLDLTPGSQLQFGVPEDPWSWVELSNGATLVRITNTPEPSPTVAPPPVTPGPQGCVVSDVATSFELEGQQGDLVVRDFRDSLEVGDRAANPGGKPPVLALTAGHFTTVSLGGRPSASALMSPTDYQRLRSRYGVKFAVPSEVRGGGTPWWVWVAIAVGVVVAFGAVLAVAARRRPRTRVHYRSS
jgi:hypothetical protein